MFAGFEQRCEFQRVLTPFEKLVSGQALHQILAVIFKRDPGVAGKPVQLPDGRAYRRPPDSSSERAASQTTSPTSFRATDW